MLHNYLTIAWRNLTKRGGFSAINIVGLAFGLAVCLLIVLLPLRQWRMDRFHDHAGRIHRVLTDTPESFGTSAAHGFATTPAPLAPLIRSTYTGVEAAVRMRQTGANLVHGEKRIVLERQNVIGTKGLYVEPSFFRVFDGFRVEDGNGQEALRRPFSVVLAPEAARRLFGEENPIGQTVRLVDIGDFTVTGVLADPAGRSHLDFEALFSFSSLRAQEHALSDWSNVTSTYTYLLLEEGADPHAVEAQLEQSGDLLQSANPDFDPQADFERNPFPLQSILDIALSAQPGNEVARPMLPLEVLFLLGGLALVIILAAGFNYANLSVARSLSRSREVGVRRAMGATRSQVAKQFLGEAVLTSMLALAVALVLLQGLLPAFNSLRVVHILELYVRPSVLGDGIVLALFVGFTVLVGGLSGIYPALVLSRFRPIEVLRGGATRASDRLSLTGMNPRFRLRKVLTASQFVLSLLLLVTGALVYQQARYMAQADFGFAPENVAIVDVQEASYETIRNEAQTIQGVERVAGTSLLPASGRSRAKSVRVVGTNREASPYVYAVDRAFLESMGLSFASGGPPSQGQFDDGRGVVLNPAALRALGLGTPTEAHGQRVDIDSTTYRVVGTVNNFRFRGSRDGRSEAVMLYAGAPSDFDYALMRTVPDAGPRVLDALEGAWPQMDAENPFRGYSYEDLLYEQHALLYAEGARVVGLAALLAIMVSCLGLLGMVAYQVEARRKEVAVRRAMGASEWNMVVLLSKGFLVLVSVAVAVGLPLAWMLNSLWLQQLSVRIRIDGFTLAGCAAMLIMLALTAVGSQALRAARLDPATTLRDE